MIIDVLCSRLESGKPVDHVYHRDGLAGIVAIWKYEDRFILTWDECPDGQELDESTYTRSERHEFPNASAAVEYLREHSFDLVSW